MNTEPYDHDQQSCKEEHHPWMDCPKCEHCGEFHCSLNAVAHMTPIFNKVDQWQS